MRTYTQLDRVLGHVQDALITLFADNPVSARPSPAQIVTDDERAADVALSAADRQRSIGFMRVNHTGEVCAQALYRGQAVLAQRPEVDEFLAHAEIEEYDHLVWCHKRLQSLGAHRSFLNVYWYAHSFFLGWFAGRIGDQWSLGFVEETERQVGEHLAGHLNELAVQDRHSRVVLEQMVIDEAEHGAHASALGGRKLPRWIQILMRAHSKVMTTVAYWV